MSIAERIATVQAQIEAACVRAGRSPDTVTLVAVSKTHPASAVIEAAAAGILNFGENRLEEADKITIAQTAYPGLQWHMIGHVQSRKAREVIAHYNWIHSLDSVKLAERYSRFAIEQGKLARVLLEVNVSGEVSKEGLQASAWQSDTALRAALWDDVRQISELPGLQVAGLMTMAPIVEHMEAARPVFAALRMLHEALRADFPKANWDTLSMGMTDDFPVAIEEGATLVRIGRAIFGARETV